MAKKMFSGWDASNNRLECMVIREEDRQRVVDAFKKNKKVVKITENGARIWKR